MTTYYCDIDYGMGGDDTVEAADIQEAMSLAMQWAAEADWSECSAEQVEARIRVWRENEDGEVVEEAIDTYTIQRGDTREDDDELPSRDARALEILRRRP